MVGRKIVPSSTNHTYRNLRRLLLIAVILYSCSPSLAVRPCFASSPEPEQIGDAVQDKEQIVHRVAELKAEVSKLRFALKNRYRSLSLLRNNATNEAQQLKLAIAKQRTMLRAIDSAKNTISDTIDDLNTKLIPVVMETIRQHKLRIQAGIPFQQKQRLDRLLKIQDHLESPIHDATFAATQLWKVLKSELQLAQTSQLDFQTINIRWISNAVLK